MILLMSFTPQNIAIAIGIFFAGAVVGMFFMKWGDKETERLYHTDSKVVNLDEYETFEDKRYEWRKETVVNN